MLKYLVKIFVINAREISETKPRETGQYCALRLVVKLEYPDFFVSPHVLKQSTLA